MRFLSIFFLGLCAALAFGKALQRNSDNDRETEGAEYEADENDNAREYVQNDQDSLKDESQRARAARYEDGADPQTQEENEDVYQESNAENSFNENKKEFSDDKRMYDQKIRNSRNEDIVNEGISSNKRNMFEQGRSFNGQISSINRPSITQNLHKSDEINDFNSYSHAEENDGEFLFKNCHDESKKEIHDYQKDEASNSQQFITTKTKESFNPEKDFDGRSDKKMDNAYIFERARREVSKSDETNEDTNNSPNDKNLGDSNNNNEPFYRNDIKELSKQDLEELLSSLSKEKINIIKKIINDNENINKREITKKAGAAEDAYVDGERIDATRIQEDSHASVETDSTLSHNMGTTEANKATDNNSFKISSNDNDATKSENSVTMLSVDLKKDKSKLKTVNSEIFQSKDQSHNEKMTSESKNENKRETGLSDFSNLSECYNAPNQQNLKDYKESPTDKDLSYFENHDWVESVGEEIDKTGSHNLKRDISDLSDSIKSLDESFPDINAAENANIKSNLKPLIRVKRTDTGNSDVKENINVQFSNLKESGDLEKDEKGEEEDYGYIGQEKLLSLNDGLTKEKKLDSNYKQKQNVKYRNNKKENYNLSLNNKNDCTLSTNVDSSSRIKRTENNMKNDNLFQSQKKDNALQDTGTEIIEPGLEKESFIRYKRIRQVKEFDHDKKGKNKK